MQKTIFKILTFRRLGVLRYNSIGQNLAALFYLALAGERSGRVVLLESLAFMLFSLTMTAFGYLLNDLADRQLDRTQGKANVFAAVPPAQAGGLVAVVALAGAVCALPFVNRPGFLLLWGLWIAAAVSYSLPPLRLKTRGLPGLVMTVAAQQTLPVALLFAALGQPVSLAALVFGLFATARGLSSDTGHQLRDWALDSAAGAGTFAVRFGRGPTQAVYAASLEFERLALGSVVAFLLFKLPAVTLPSGFSVYLGWPVALAYSALFLLTAGASLAAWRRGDLAENDPYDEARQSHHRDALHLIHHTLPTVALPLYLLLPLGLARPALLLLGLLPVLLYAPFLPWRKAPAGVDPQPALEPASPAVSVRREVPPAVVPLAQAGKDFGTKAANLARLIAAGLPVPDGYCVRLEGHGMDLAEVEAEVEKISHTFAGPVVVRSSADHEDQPHASYAGQYESTLNLEGPQAVWQAVKHCAGGTSSQRLDAYLAHQGVTGLTRPPAVIIQAMIDAQVSGVLFTTEPTQADKNYLIIEAGPGSADRYTSGTVTPARLVIDRRLRLLVSTQNTHILPAAFKRARAWKALVEWAMKAERVLGAPQDIEWAFGEGRFWILQSRPISRPAVSSPWTRANIGEVMPGLVTPLTWSAFLHAVEQGEPEGGAAGASQMATLIEGRAYMHLPRLWESYNHLLGIKPETVLARGLGCDLEGQALPRPGADFWQGWRMMILKNVWVWTELLVQRLYGPAVDRQLREDLPIRLESARMEQLEQFSAEAVWNSALQALSLAGMAFAIHMRTSFFALASFGALHAWLARWVGEPVANQVVAAGQPGKAAGSWEAEVTALVKQAQTQLGLRRVFETLAGDALYQALRESAAGQAFVTALVEAAQRLGNRSVQEFEMSMPSASDDPRLLLASVRARLIQPEQGAAASPAPRNALAVIDRRHWLARPLAARLQQAFTSYSRRRESTKTALAACFAELRRRFQHLDQCMLDLGWLEQPGDIYFLTLPEIQALFDDARETVELRSRARQRRLAYRRYEAAELALAVESPDTGSSLLAGTGVSSGRVTGRARIVTDPFEAALVEGEILVTQATDPGWTPLFLVSAAIVTEAGGVLSHTATLARELNKPAVFAVPSATRLIQDGQWITVDGTRGQVYLHDHPAVPQPLSSGTPSYAGAR